MEKELIEKVETDSSQKYTRTRVSSPKLHEGKFKEQGKQLFTVKVTEHLNKWC